ncbi:NAD(P)H-dependent oxidoreductase [Rhizorhapis sp. SPR117]|uniref:NAD(P)H-dependent oxidoreductase n=1 Tax=Rhizorhapis sp. SPR117 TaxID=2912611 RepID=UPI001F27583B|nr:NAD(P)H-dependent oxidoreductase [Rhizorhapis sp. SPR117]
MDGTDKRRARHVVVLAHPDPDSFNATIARAYCDAVIAFGQEASVRDLYAMGFDPRLKNSERPDKRGTKLATDVRAELDALSGSDVIALVYPIWFGMPPAILKGYIDRVVGAGVTPQQVQHRAAEGPLTAGHMVSITTSGAPEEWLHEQGQIQSLRELATLYLFRAFSMHSADYLHIGGIVEDLPKDIIEGHLSDVRAKAGAICERIAVERYGALPKPTIYDGS